MCHIKSVHNCQNSTPESKLNLTEVLVLPSSFFLSFFRLVPFIVLHCAYHTAPLKNPFNKGKRKVRMVI